ncbi:MAG: glycosyltransferase [Candidatus Paceibacterota bacterium]|jgi:glycosyltransferase involved in cell wall biosynthesis
MQQENLITVIIPTYKHEERLTDLVDLVCSLSTTSNIKYIREIIIVDNGNSLSVDSGTLKLRNYNKVKIIEEKRVGLNYARNTGITEAVADIISFLDDDVIVSEHWAKNIVCGYSEQDILCVGGPVFVKDKETKKWPVWFSNYFLRFLLPPNFPRQAGHLYAPYFIIGANMSFKRETFKRFGMFDPDLDRKGGNLLSNGDTEFLIRIPQSMVWYEPQAEVWSKIKEKRLTRIFMTRRLFWQGISDYIMVKKRGLENFYDKKEVYLTIYFFKELTQAITKLNFFEAFCRFIRLFGYKYAFIYIKKKER